MNFRLEKADASFYGSKITLPKLVCKNCGYSRMLITASHNLEECPMCKNQLDPYDIELSKDILEGDYIILFDRRYVAEKEGDKLVLKEYLSLEERVAQLEARVAKLERNQ